MLEQNALYSAKFEEVIMNVLPLVHYYGAYTYDIVAVHVHVYWERTIPVYKCSTTGLL